MEADSSVYSKKNEGKLLSRKYAAPEGNKEKSLWNSCTGLKFPLVAGSEDAWKIEGFAYKRTAETLAL